MTEAATIANGRVAGPPSEDVLDALERIVQRQADESCLKYHPELHGYLAGARGVLHVGAHIGQERDVYGDLPVIWIEAVPMVYEVLRERIAKHPRQRAHCHLVADGKSHWLWLASNACQSSSIFDLKRHREIWPEVDYVGAIEVQSVTLKEVIERHDVNLNVYDTLVLDVQGAELLVLQGAGEYLERFRMVRFEAPDFEAYDGGCTLTDVGNHLARHGFTCEQSITCRGKPGVGNYYEVLYRNTGRTPAVTAPSVTAEPGSLRLNIGAGALHMTGFTNLDHKTGQEAYPLDYPDSSVEEILASHVLEHFSHLEVSLVLQDWVRVLKPGGKIRLAVPDFEKVARDYLDGKPINVQGYVMGGHIDVDDRHGCIFDRESLSEVMAQCGLERISLWHSDLPACSSLPHSLNLQGFKPAAPELPRMLENVRACMSVPRFGPLMHPRCVERAMGKLRITVKAGSSCYWHQMLSQQVEESLADPTCQFVLTMDYDTIFSASDVLELYRLLQVFPEADAVIPLQSKRGCEQMLFSLPGREAGKVKGAVSEGDLSRLLLPASTGHFGLTMFRADSLRKFPRPWMVPKPSPTGRWDQGQTDADIDFWLRFRAAGFRAFLAPRIVVGHLEEIIKWPGKDLKPVYQTTSDYEDTGIPPEAAR